MAIISNDLMGYSKLLYLVWVIWGLGQRGSRGDRGMSSRRRPKSYVQRAAYK